MNNQEVDQWIAEHGESDAYHLLDERMPKMRKKLDRLDKRLIDVLAEVRKEFPDAEYYTASGGFTLSLGNAIDDPGISRPQRSAWSGLAQIGDGDY